MTKKTLLIALLSLTLLSLAFAQSRQTWEYKFVQMKLDFKKTDVKLNELGSEGWEVINVNDEGGIANVYLKRAK